MKFGGKEIAAVNGGAVNGGAVYLISGFYCIYECTGMQTLYKICFLLTQAFFEIHACNSCGTTCD